MREMWEHGKVHPTGPRTEEGKAISRLNPIQTGEYTKVVELDFSCSACHFQDYCKLYAPGKSESVCEVFGSVREFLKGQTNAVLEMELQCFREKAAFERALKFGSKEAIFWAGLLGKHLEILHKMKFGEKISVSASEEKFSETASRVARVDELLREGKTPQEIAELLGVARRKDSVSASSA
jgi:hypothetical protein